MPQLCNAVNGRQSFSGRWNFPKVTSPRLLTFCLSWVLNTGCQRTGQSRDLALSKPVGEYWYCSFCNINVIIRTQTHQIVIVVIQYWQVSLPYFFIFHFVWSHRLTDDVTGALLGHRCFSSIALDRIQIENRERHQCDGWRWASESTDMLTPLSQSMTWGGVTWPWPFQGRGKPRLLP